MHSHLRRTLCQPSAAARADILSQTLGLQEICRHGPFTLFHAWPHPDELTRRSIIDFWAANDALPAGDPELGERRARQVVVIAREHETNKIAGVSTAVATPVESLGFPCFYYRTFVAPEQRASWVLSKAIFLNSYRLLNERFQQGCDADVLGLLIEVQNESLQRHLKYAVWALDGMNVVYIGKNSKGIHRRVWYFEGAEVP